MKCNRLYSFLQREYIKGPLKYITLSILYWLEYLVWQLTVCVMLKFTDYILNFIEMGILYWNKVLIVVNNNASLYDCAVVLLLYVPFSFTFRHDCHNWSAEGSRGCWGHTVDSVLRGSLIFTQKYAMKGWVQFKRM